MRDTLTAAGAEAPLELCDFPKEKMPTTRLTIPTF